MVNRFTKASIALSGVFAGIAIWVGSAAYDHFILGLGSFIQCLLVAPDATIVARTIALSSAIMIGIGGQLVANRFADDRLLKLLFDYSNDGLMLVDPKTGNILKSNYRATDFLGYTKEELCRMNLANIHPHDYPLAKQFIERVVNDGYDITDKVSCQTKDGSLMPAEVSGSIIRHGNNEHVLVSMRNISIRVRVDQERKAALGREKVANRVKSEFLATMSHEFRTPLNAILGFSDILTHQYLGPQEPGKYQEYAKDINSSAEHLLELVNDLLDISAIEAGKTTLDKQALAVKDVIADCTRTIKGRAEAKGIELETKVPKDIPPLHADRRAIKQILLNLLSNAVNFTPKGGKITVLANTSDDNIEIVIMDTGKGISTDHRLDVKNPFTRGEKDPYKTDKSWRPGLGLVIAKSLIDLHDGTMDIKSQVGKGTAITVTLPNGGY